MPRTTKKKRKNDYVIQPAKTGRSHCRKCKSKIAEGEKRVGITHPDYPDSYKWHHMLCAAKEGIIKMEQAQFHKEDNAIWIKASLKAADDHHKNTPCTCDTFLLVSQGCQCGAFEKEAEKKANGRAEARRDLGAMFGPSAVKEFDKAMEKEDAESGPQVLQEGGHTHTFTPGLEGDIFKTKAPDPNLITAASVLAEKVEEAYKPAADRVARAKAEAETVQASFVVGMTVYHALTHKGYIIDVVKDNGYCEVTGEDEKPDVIRASLLTPINPGVVARTISLYEHNSKVRLVIWMSALMTVLFGSVSAMLVSAFFLG